jgi:hypothetical protein
MASTADLAETERLISAPVWNGMSAAEIAESLRVHRHSFDTWKAVSQENLELAVRVGEITPAECVKAVLKLNLVAGLVQSVLRSGYRPVPRYVLVFRDESTGRESPVRGKDGEPFTGTLEEARAFVARPQFDISDDPPSVVVLAGRVGGGEFVELARGTTPKR